MARPTAAQKQAQTVLKARDKAAAERAGQAHSAGSPAQTGAPCGPLSSNSPGYDPLLSVDQVSDWLGIPKGTLYQWRSRCQGPRAIKIGNGIRYRRSEIETYLDLHTDVRPA